MELTLYALVIFFHDIVFQEHLFFIPIQCIKVSLRFMSLKLSQGALFPED